MYRLIYAKSYNERATKFLQKHPKLVEQYKKTLSLLALNPHHPSLRLHKLSGRLKNLSSISINLSYRITLEFLITEKEILLVDIGSHDEVY